MYLIINVRVKSDVSSLGCMLRPVEYGVLCLPSLSVNGTQLDRVVLINEECYKTWSWNLRGVDLGQKEAGHMT